MSNTNEAAVICPVTGAVTRVRYHFGKLTHTGYEDDPNFDHLRESPDGIIPEGEDVEEFIRQSVKDAEDHIRPVLGRYRSRDAAMRALIDAGFAADEVYEMEW